MHVNGPDSSKYLDPAVVLKFDAESNVVICSYKTGPNSYEILDSMTLLQYQCLFGLNAARLLMRS